MNRTELRRKAGRHFARSQALRLLAESQPASAASTRTEIESQAREHYVAGRLFEDSAASIRRGDMDDARRFNQRAEKLAANLERA